MKTVICALIAAGALILAFLVLSAYGAVYYVATDGSNGNPGTIEEPWATIDYAASASSGVAAGDTVYVRGGNYEEGNITPSISGNGNVWADSLIKVWEYPSEEAIFDSSRLTFDASGVGFYWFKGIRFLHGAGNGFRATNGGRITDPDTLVFLLDSCEFKYMKTNGLSVAGGGDEGSFLVIGCSFDSNGVWGGVAQEPGTGAEINSGNFYWFHQDTFRYNQIKGISCLGEAGDSCVICSCYIWDSYEMGLGWWGDSAHIMYNTIAWNGVRDPETGEWGDAGMRLDAGSSGCYVHHNLIRSSGRYELTPSGPGNFIWNNTIIKNVMYTTVPGSPDANAIQIFDASGDDKVFVNNLITNYVPDEDHIYVLRCSGDRYVGQDWDYNCWWSEYADSTAGANWKTFYVGGYKTFSELRIAYPGEDVHSINQNPLFISYADSNYTLQYWSPCIDAGEDTICTDPLILLTGFAGGAPDMGCFEYDTTGPRLTIPPYTGSVLTWNYGRVAIGDSSSETLTLYSTGDDTLVIQSILTTDSVWTTDYAEADSMIVPGDSLEVEVKYKPLDTTVLDDTLTVQSNDTSVLVLLHGGGVVVETIKTIIW